MTEMLLNWFSSSSGSRVILRFFVEDGILATEVSVDVEEVEEVEEVALLVVVVVVAAVDSEDSEVGLWLVEEFEEPVADLGGAFFRFC